MIILVIPVHNAAPFLPTFLAALQVATVDWGQPYHALVVDDGSNDGTAEIVTDFATYGDLVLLRHKEPLGEGMALRTGLRAALGQLENSMGAASDLTDIVVTMKADFPHSPATVRTMTPLIGQRADVIVASRFNTMKNLSNLSSRTCAALLGLAFPVRGVSDLTSPILAIRATTLRDVDAGYSDHLIQEPDSACWLELLLKLANSGAPRFAEVPLIEWRTPQVAGRTLGIGRTMELIRRCWRYK